MYQEVNVGGLHLGKKTQFFRDQAGFYRSPTVEGAQKALYQLDHPCLILFKKGEKTEKSQCAGLALPLTLLSSWAVCFLAKKDDKSE